MNVRRGLLAGFAALMLTNAAWAQAPSDKTGTRAGSTANISMDQIQNWSEASKKAAKAMLEKYGQPNEATATMWVWHNNGPWKRTVVYSEPVQHNFPMPHEDVLEQFINYAAPPDKFDELAKYDGSVIVERTKGVLSARCDKEPMNFLAVNLANDVATGKRSVEDARKFYGKTAMEFMQGKQSPYTQGFVFNVPKGNVGDPGQPLKGMKQDEGVGGSGEPMKHE